MKQAVGPVELTLRAVVLGIVLSIVLGAANVYLGLKAGMTVAASVPAAVISMGLLRLWGRTSILENNLVQTAASAGESLAAGVIFVLPALVILNVWTEFHYWETTAIATLGGVLGVLFTIPLRHSLIDGMKLAFPEGVATAEVLKVGSGEERGGLKVLALGGILGAVVKICESGFHVAAGAVSGGFRAAGSVFGLGSALSPALVAVGYIVGLNIALVVFIGGVINWGVAIPIVSNLDGFDTIKGYEALEPYALAKEFWSTRTRYIGVGAMVIGGLWALVSLRKSLWMGLVSSMSAWRTEGSHRGSDLPMKWIFLGVVTCSLALVWLMAGMCGSWVHGLVVTAIMLPAGFVFSAIAAYMAGMVGSSNNPVSGVTIATVLTASLLLLALGMESTAGVAAALFVGGVVCCAAAIGGDNMQDLKAGQLVGASPWKQQVMQLIGVVAGALVMAPVLMLLLKAYGIGTPVTEGVTPLGAPQAMLMASVAKGVFDRNLPWDMIISGAVLACVVISIDEWLRRSGRAFRMPVLAVAVGVYLPLELSVAILLGGLLAWAAGKSKGNNGLLCAAGLITGEALMGITLAGMLVACDGNPLKLATDPSSILGVILLAITAGLLYAVARRKTPTGR